MDDTSRIFAKQREFERLPSSWACGPTSLYAGLKLLGRREVTFKQIVRLAGESQFGQELKNILDWIRPEDEAGLDQEHLTRAARRLGVRAVCRRPSEESKAWNLLQRWSDQGRPALLAVEDGGHWVLAYGADASGAWVMDPIEKKEGFEWMQRGRLLDWWYDDGDQEYYALALQPASPRARELWKRYGFPPSDVLFNQIDDEDAEAEAVELRETLAEIFDDIPQHGERAHRLFAGVAPSIVDAITTWLSQVDARWLKDQCELMGDLLRGLPYRVAALYREQFLVDATVTLAADALVASEAELGSADEDDLLTYEEDAAQLLGRKTTGGHAATWFAKRESLLAKRIGRWLAYSSPGGVRRHLRALAAAARRCRVGSNPHELLIGTTALLTAYCWYEP